MSPRPQYTLKHPIYREIIEADGNIREEVLRPAGTTLDLRRSQGRDAEAMAKIEGEMQQTYYMLHRATRLTMEEISYMDLLDIKHLGAVLKGFTEEAAGSPAGQPTSENALRT